MMHSRWRAYFYDALTGAEVKTPYSGWEWYSMAGYGASPRSAVVYDDTAWSVEVGNGEGKRAEITAANVRTLARWLGPVWPSGPGLKDFTATGGLEWSDGVVAIHNGVFRLDGNEANGELLADLNGAQPLVSGTLAAQTLDLSPYMPALIPPPGRCSSSPGSPPTTTSR